MAETKVILTHDTARDAAAGIGLMLGFFLGTVFQLSRGGEPFGRALEYAANDGLPNKLVSPNDAITSFMISGRYGSLEDFYSIMQLNGFNKEQASVLIENARYSGEALARTTNYEANLRTPNNDMNPEELIRVHRLHPTIITREELNGRLKRLGYTDELIEQLLKLTEAFPPPQDIIRFAVREVYSPDIVDKYMMDEGLEPDSKGNKGIDKTDFKRAGVSDEVLTKYWRAHWQLPPITQGYEFLHRFAPDVLKKKQEAGMVSGELAERIKFDSEDLKTLLKVLDVSPYWRERMEQLSYQPISRVDLRRMFELRLIDEDMVYVGYRELGYSPEYAELLKKYTVVERDLPYLRASYSNGYITQEQLREEIRKFGLRADVEQKIFEKLVESQSKERTKQEKDLNKTEILKGFKAGLIDSATAIDKLMGLGYDEEEASYIVGINLPSA